MEVTLHCIEADYKIKCKEREARNGHKSSCLWFTGLSGSGKSTLANSVEQELFNLGYMTYVLDGDNVRRGLNKDLTFNERDRVENIRRVSEVANLMCDAGVIVLAAFISPFRKDRKMLKQLLNEKFFEIFVDTPLAVCEQRDVKGLYGKARSGEIANFTGITSPYEVPESPNIHIRTDMYTIKQAVDLIITQVITHIKP